VGSAGTERRGQKLTSLRRGCTKTAFPALLNELWSGRGGNKCGCGGCKTTRQKGQASNREMVKEAVGNARFIIGAGFQLTNDQKGLHDVQKKNSLIRGWGAFKSFVK